MNNIVTIKNLIKTYDKGRTKALDDINLKIKEGSFVSIMGPSGSGKSTLLNMIGALDMPDKGLIEVAGQDISQIKDLSLFRRETVGFVFQLHNLIPNLTSRENVEIPMYGTGMTSEAMKTRSLNLLKSVGLENKTEKKPNILSGGERQRVAVARALANNPKIILADEPTGSLDTKNGSIIMELLQYHQKKLGATLILVTHDQKLAKTAENTIQIQDGKTITPYT
jgi:putative ABC transport system ATP-binding protein